MKDLLIVAILLVLVGIAIWYVYKAKKSGKKCIGCPDGCCTSKKSSKTEHCSCGCCGENTHTHDKSES